MRAGECILRNITGSCCNSCLLKGAAAIIANPVMVPCLELSSYSHRSWSTPESAQEWLQLLVICCCSCWCRSRAQECRQTAAGMVAAQWKKKGNMPSSTSLDQTRFRKKACQNWAHQPSTRSILPVSEVNESWHHGHFDCDCL